MNVSSKNIVLVGMCGVGKSTVGVLLAKALGRYFLDTDVYIQAIEGCRLQYIIDSRGLDEFCKIEEKHILCIDMKNAVIATGGSAVYSDRAMMYLKSSGIIVHLELDFAAIEKRVSDIASRGIVKRPSQSLQDLYTERMPLYRKYADIIIDCNNKTHAQLVHEIVKILEANQNFCSIENI